MSITIPSLRIGGQSMRTSEIVPESSSLSEMGRDISEMGRLQEDKERREARAWNVKASNDLRLASTEALEAARVEAEDPNQIGSLFFEKIKETKGALAESAPNRYASDEFDLSFDNIRTQYGQKAISLEVNEGRKLRRLQIEDSLQSQLNGIRNGGDYEEGFVAVNEYLDSASDIYSAAELAELKDNASGQLKGNHLDYLFESGQVDEVRTLINDSDYNKDLGSRQIDSYRTAIRRVKDQQRDQQKTASALLGSIEQMNFLDPKDKKVRKSIDGVFKASLEEGFLQADPEAFGATLELSAQSGVVPDTVKSFIRAARVSRNPGQKQLAFQYISDLDTLNPAALNASGIKQQDIDEAKMYSYYKNMGVPENEALSFIKNELNPDDKYIIDMRREALKADILAKGDPNVIDPTKMLDIGFFESEPDVMAGYQGLYAQEWSDLYSKYYTMSGNKEFAEERAQEVFKGKYSTTSIFGDEYLTPYPADKVYSRPEYKQYDVRSFGDEPVDHTPKLLRGQLLNDLKKVFGKEVNLSDFRLVSDGITEKEVRAGKLPSYKLYKVTDDYGPQLVDRYHFDPDDLNARFRQLVVDEKIDRKSIMRQRERQDAFEAIMSGKKFD